MSAQEYKMFPLRPPFSQHECVSYTKYWVQLVINNSCLHKETRFLNYEKRKETSNKKNTAFTNKLKKKL